jgi:DNA-binding PadR family transcriptional regulator
MARLLSPLHQHVLLAMIDAKGEVTTTGIYEALAARLKRVSLGAIYVTLDRLIEKKFITRRRGEPLPERGGKARYYYKITNSGRAAVIETQKAITSWGSVLGKLSTAG